ncbi:MAG: alpha-1 4-glucan-protein synthase, partial [Halobacteriota archaeon]
MPSHDVCVVVPTIRDYDCVEAYVDNARAHGFPTERLYFVLVTEDFCDTREMQNLLDGLDVDGQVFDASARERWYDEREVADYAHVVPEASHAETSFGLLYLWHEGYDYGVFIDDDTQPLEDHDFFGRHMENLATEGEVRRLSSDERWVNVLHDTPHDLYPRGYPYSAMDEEVHEDKVEVKRGDVVASQGLWT